MTAAANPTLPKVPMRWRSWVRAAEMMNSPVPLVAAFRRAAEGAGWSADDIERVFGTAELHAVGDDVVSICESLRPWVHDLGDIE